MTKQRSGWRQAVRWLVLAAAAHLSACGGCGSPPGTVAGGTFTEKFDWKGQHAAVTPDGKATTVWWNADHWDARGDSSHNAVAVGEGNAIDIRRADPAPSNGLPQDDRYVLGGDGSPGVGIMHVDFQGIMSARLRNPMVISADKPGSVSFRTSNFVTTGHWWEIAITPTGIVRGAEFTGVPDTDDTFNGNPGSGHRPAEDSLNFITIGKNDVPCTTGWKFMNGVTFAQNRGTTTLLGPELASAPEAKWKLIPWRLDFYPDRVEAFFDKDDDGTLEPHATFNVNIPWREVYVHLLGVAYQADHHPQEECFQGQVRDLPWKDVRIEPMKYSRTASYPKDDGATRSLIQSGWTGYDLRDSYRYGTLGGVAQPNAGPYYKHASMGLCHGDFYDCPTRTLTDKTLSFELPAADATGIARAQLVYDIRESGSVTVAVNGKSLGTLPRTDTVPAALNEDTHWVERSVDVDPALLKAGTNTVTFHLEGMVALDRMHFELAYE